MTLLVSDWAVVLSVLIASVALVLVMLIAAAVVWKDD